MQATAIPRRVMLQARLALFPPGSAAEQFYYRHLRRFARALRPVPVPAAPTAVRAHTSPGIARAVDRIMVLKLDHIGDFLIAAPAFALLRRAFPAAHITLLCGPWNEALAESSQWFDAIAPLAFFDAAADGTTQRFAPSAIAALGAFDLAIDLRVDEDTRPVLAALNARLKVAYAAPGIAGLTIALPPPPVAPQAYGDLTQHRRAQLLAVIAAAQTLDPLNETAALLARATIPLATDWPHPILAVAPGSGRAIKNWPLANFIAVLARFQAERGGTVILLGGAREQSDARAIAAALPPAATVDLTAGLSLAQSFGIIAAADIFLGNDSALGHAAAALGKPSLVIFSGIDPLPNWIPLGPHTTALKTEIACSPCHLSDLALCPNAHRCLTAITPDHVWRALPLTPASIIPASHPS